MFKLTGLNVLGDVLSSNGYHYITVHYLVDCTEEPE